MAMGFAAHDIALECEAKGKKNRKSMFA